MSWLQQQLQSKQSYQETANSFYAKEAEGAERLRTKGKVKTCHREDRAPLWTRFPSLPFKGHPSAALILCLLDAASPNKPGCVGSSRKHTGSQGWLSKRGKNPTPHPIPPDFSRLHLCFKPVKEEAAPTALIWLRGDGYVLPRVPAGRAPMLRDPLFPPGRTPAPVPMAQLYHQPTTDNLPSLHPVPRGHEPNPGSRGFLPA